MKKKKNGGSGRGRLPFPIATKTVHMKNKSKRRPTPKRGEEVEVRLDGAGFRGAWYAARVIYPRPDRRTCCVVYDTLFTDDDDSTTKPHPLRETVPFANVRPRPPPSPPHSHSGFSLNQPVDAFYNDGWWPGTVSSVHGDMYAVRFPETREEIDFGPSHLRPHLDWINGKWVSPPPPTTTQKHGEKRTANHMQSLDSRSNSPKSKVNGRLKGDNEDTSILIVDGPDSEMNTVELASQSHLESYPPCKKAKEGETLEDNTLLIDCLGRRSEISGRTETGPNLNMPTTDNRPILCLQAVVRENLHCSTSSVNETILSTLNVGLETSANTMSKQAQNPHNPSNIDQETASSDRGEELVRQDFGSVNEFCDPHFLSDQQKDYTQDQHQEGKVDHDQQPQQGKAPFVKGFKIPAVGKKRGRTGSQKETIKGIQASSQGDAPKEGDCCNTEEEERNHGFGFVAIDDSNSIAQKIRSPEAHTTSHIDAETRGATCPKDSEGKVIPNTMASSSVLIGTSSSNSHHNKTGSRAPNEPLLSASETPESFTGLVSCDELGRLKCRRDGDKGKNHDLGIIVMVDSNKVNSTEDHTITHTEEETQGVTTWFKDSGGHSISDIMVDISTLIQTPRSDYHLIKDRSEVANEASLSPPGVHFERSLTVPLSDEEHSLAVGISSGELKQLECRDEVDERNHDVVMVDTNSMSHKSRSTEGGHSVSHPETATEEGGACLKDSGGQMMLVSEDRTVDVSTSTPVGTSTKDIYHNEIGSEKQEESSSLPSSGMQVARCLTGELPSRDWPFKRHSSMWESIESLGIITDASKSPHFRPLEQYCEPFREGMAIGLMVTYHTLVSSMHKSKLDDCSCALDEKKRALVNLEGHGFDVGGLRAQLDELSRIRRDYMQLSEKSCTLKVEMMEKQRKGDRLDADAEAIDNVVIDLKQMLSHLCEKKASLLKQKEEFDAEMAKLQTDVDAIEERVHSAEVEFKKVLASVGDS